MQIAGKLLRVELKADLTKYDPLCKLDSRGYTLPDVKLSKGELKIDLLQLNSVRVLNQMYC